MSHIISSVTDTGLLKINKPHEVPNLYVYRWLQVHNYCFLTLCQHYVFIVAEGSFRKKSLKYGIEKYSQHGGSEGMYVNRTSSPTVMVSFMST